MFKKDPNEIDDILNDALAKRYFLYFHELIKNGAMYSNTGAISDNAKEILLNSIVNFPTSTRNVVERKILMNQKW